MKCTCKKCGGIFFEWRMKNKNICIDCFRREVNKNGK